MKPRLKWYWRVLITWMTGVVLVLISFFAFGQSLVEGLSSWFDVQHDLVGFALIVIIHAPVAMSLSMWVYHLLTEVPREKGYTYCGRCGYILKGLVEPRCPECGGHI